MTVPHDPIADRVLDRMAPLLLGPPTWLRILLAAAVFTQFAVALPWLVGADPLGLLGAAHESHLTRDGAFAIAVGLAGAATVWRHRYALAAAMLSGAILLIQFSTGLIDGHADRVALWFELSHLPMLFVFALILLAARPRSGRHRPRTSVSEEAVDVTNRLRLVSPAADD